MSRPWWAWRGRRLHRGSLRSRTTADDDDAWAWRKDLRLLSDQTLATMGVREGAILAPSCRPLPPPLGSGNYNTHGYFWP
jgi:hypothetical protein